jgi:hypothetical protein
MRSLLIPPVPHAQRKVSAGRSVPYAAKKIKWLYFAPIAENPHARKKHAFMNTNSLKGHA